MNEFDQLLEDMNQSPASNPFDQMLDQQDTMKQRAIQSSAMVAVDTQPDRRAEVLKLSERYKLAPELVENNFDTLSRKSKIESVQPDKLVRDHRGLSDWLSDPNNMALASDELDKLKDLSETINEQGDFEKLYLALGSGFARINSSVAKIPAMGVDLYTQYAVNPMARALGYAEVGPREGLRNNAVTNFFDSAAESYTAQVPELSDKVIESALAGDFKKSSRALAFQVAANFPQMALTIGSTMAGAPGVGLAAMGGMSAASEYDEALDKGVDQGAAMANAVIAGSAEAAFERMGTIAILKKWEASIGAKLGKDTARKIMADAGKMLGVSVIQEGAEETGTSIVQDASKIATGVNPDIGRMEMVSNAANAFVLGGAMGGSMVAPSGFAMGAQRSLEMRRAQELQDFYTALGDKTNELKLKKRLPEASQKLIENLTKDGPVENIFVDPKDMQAYFQSKNMDPLEAATLYGFSKEYQEAVETGTDVKIPLAKWTTTMAETEHFQGLKDDVRFSPDGLSVRENQKIEKQLKADLKLIASQEEDSEVGKPEAELTPDQKRIRSARAVKENVKQQLLALNSPLYGPNEAEQVALLYAKGFNSLGYRSGTDPLELFNRYNLRISLGENGQLKESFDRPGDTVMAAQGQVLNQESQDPTLSPEFQKWFEGSKVVDKSGKPVRVYHGTRSEFGPDFQFDANRIGSSNDSGHYGRGFYFSTSQGEAEYYGPNVGSFFLSLKNPLDLTNNTGSLTHTGHFLDWYPKLKSIGIADKDLDSTFSKLTQLRDYIQTNATVLVAADNNGNDVGFIAKVKDAPGYPGETYGRRRVRGQGYDTREEALSALFDDMASKISMDLPSLQAFIVREISSRKMTEMASAAGYDGIQFGEEMIVFDPTKIKSTDNRGTFDPKDPRVFFQSAAQAVADVFPATPAPPTFSKLIQVAPAVERWLEATKPMSIGELSKDVFGSEMAGLMPLNVVDGGMLTALKNDKVRKFVISLFPVDVVNHLASAKLSPKDLFSQKNVVANALSVDARKAVAVGVVSAIREAHTGITTKLRGLGSTGSTVELGPTLSANDLNAREVAALLDPQRIFHLDGDVAPEARTSTGPVTESLSEDKTRVPRNKLGPTELAELLNAHAELVQGKAQLLQQFSQPSSGHGFELFQSKPFYGDFNAPSGVKSVAVPSLTDDGTTLESAQKEVLSGGELKVRVPRGGEIVIDKTFFEKTKNEVFEPKRPRGDGPLSAEEKRAAVIIAKNIETVMKDAILDSREETRGVGTKASKDLVDHYKRYYGVVNIDGVPFAYQMKAQVLKAARGKPKFQQLYFEFARKLEAPALSGEPDSGEGLKIDQNLRGNNSLFPLPTEISIGDFAKIINSLRAKYPLFQSGEAEDSNRARIVIGANKTMRIELFKKADLSSFLHETGHFWFEVMADLAKEPNANPALVADYQTVKDWLGETDESLDARRAEASEIASRAQRENRELTKEENARINELVEPFEKWARAFELYLAKGEAPSLDLKKAFAHFKVWLLNVYKDLRRLNVELTPEIKGVMDRMLATDAELEAAYLGHPPLFKGDAFDGMNPETAEKYQKAIEDAKQEASESLTAKVVEREFKKREAAYKEKRKAVRARIEEEANGLRIYRALSILQKGTLPDGSALPEGTPQIKIDKQSIVQAYGKEFLDRLPRPFVYAKEGGVDYNMAAEMLGFESGDAMLTEMANAQPKKAYIESRTDEEMDVLYPDEVMEQFPAEAVKAAHSEGRSKLLRMELELLVQNNLPVFKDAIRRVARRVPTEAEVRAQARQLIAGKRIAEIKPYTFERAEVKSAKEAGIALAKGDIEAAFEHKRRELLNHELFRAANEAIEEHEKALEFFKKFGQKDEDLAKSRDMDLVNAGRAILSEYDIGKSEKTREEILKYMQAYAPESFESISTLIDSVGLKPGNFDEITHEEFSKLNETVRAIWTLSRQAKNIEIDGKKVLKEEAISELISQVDSVKELKPDKEFKKVTGEMSENKLGWLGLRARFRRTESFVTSMDRGFGGPFRTYIWQPISDATANYRIAKAKTYNDLMEMLKQWQSESNMIKTPIRSAEIGAEFENKAQLIGAILHTGNESNKEKLLVGYGWGSVLEDGSLDSSRWDQFMSRMYAEGIVTKADMDFVQRIWDLNESLKPAAQKAHKEMYGFYFNEITANEVQTPFGNYRGGYVPAVADPNQVPEASIRGDKEALLQGGNSSMFPTTGRGFTKSRVENYNVKLSLDLKRIGSHVDKVLRFVHIEPKVKEVARIVTNKKFMASMNEVDPAAVQNIIIPMLQRAAQQSVSKPFTGTGARWLNKFTSELRKRTGLQIMFFNTINTIQQLTGFSIAAVRVGPQHLFKARYLRNAILEIINNPNAMSKEVAKKSAFMESRLNSQMVEINQLIEDIAIDPSLIENSRRFIQKHGYFMQSATQNIVDVTVWAAAYEQGIESGMGDVEAVRFADSAVRETQGSMSPEDIAAFEAGNPAERLFTMFQGFFSMLANLGATEFTIAKDMGLRKGAGRMFYVYMMAGLIPAFVSKLIVMAGAGVIDEDDDDEYLDDLLDSLFWSQAETATAMIPFAGPVLNTSMKTWNSKPYDDRLMLSPVINTIEQTAAAPTSVYNAIVNDGSKRKAARDVLTAVGMLSGIPTGPIQRPLSYLADIEDGKANPTGPVDFTRGLITGRPGTPQ